MISITDEDNKSFKGQKACNICNGGFCYGKNKKKSLNCTKKSEISVITLENLEELLIVFEIYVIKYLKKYQ